MADQTQAIEAESQALASDLDRAATMAAEITTMFGTAVQNLKEIEGLVGRLLQSSDERLTDFAEQISTQAEQTAERANGFSEAIGQAAEAVAKGTERLTADGETMRTALTGATESLTAMTEGAATVDETAKQNLETLVGAFETATGELSSRLQAGEQTLSEFTSLVNATQDEWRGFIDTVAQTLETAMTECAASVDQSIVQDMQEASETFREALEDILHNVIEQPVSALRDEAQAAISEEMTRIADEAVTAITDLVKETIQEVLGSRDRNDAEERVMRELFDRLRPIFDDVWSQFGVVDGIASAVGVRI